MPITHGAVVSYACLLLLWTAAVAPAAVFQGIPAAAHQYRPPPFQVLAMSPVANAYAASTTAVSMDFNLPVDAGSVTSASLRVFGEHSGPSSGTYSFSNGNRTLTLTPSAPFAAGEVVRVTVSGSLRDVYGGHLRSKGYAWRFTIRTTPSTGTFDLLQVLDNNLVPNSLWDLVPADMNGDGFIDLVAYCQLPSSRLHVYLNSGDGSGLFLPVPQEIATPTTIAHFRTADFNADGHIDVCGTSGSNGRVLIAYGDGAGSFSSVVSFQTASASYGVDVLDVDGDGDEDLAAAQLTQPTIQILVNDGNGIFHASTPQNSGHTGSYNLASGDFDGDFNEDLFVLGPSWGNARSMLLARPEGGFELLGPPIAHPGGVEIGVGDKDGDGDLDVVTAGYFFDTISVLNGLGDGTFQSNLTLNGGNFVIAVDFGDIDGDDDLDLASVAHLDGEARVYRNVGSASFGSFQSLPMPGRPTRSVLFDFDNDGDLDLAVSDEAADVIHLFVN